MVAEQGHVPVLLQEAIDGLAIRQDGVYLDGTFGRGGHSAAILARLGALGHLYAIDQDVQAIEFAAQRFADDPRFSIAHNSFANLAELCQRWGVAGRLDGVLLDIGVSSPQLDDAQRGFSFMRDGPLDMRMNQSAGQSAAEWLADAAEEQIADVIYQYGEERNARRIARRIVERRQSTAITSTAQLADIVASASRVRDRRKHPATRTFQAIRIHINQELEMLEQALQAAMEVLQPGGRLVVISFHSLEDRKVKQFMRDQAGGKPPADTRIAGLPRGLPAPIDAPQAKPRLRRLRLVGKATKPGEAEQQRNPRARSSVLRVAEKLA